MELIYFDNAATTLHKPLEVVQAVSEALGSFGGVGRGVHGASLNAGMTVYEARAALAQLFGAPSAAQVSFACNATEALNIAISGLLLPGERALTTVASHNSVLRPMYRKRDEDGCEVAVAPVLPDGALNYEEFARMLEPATKLVVATHASNLTGDVYDIARMAHLAHEAGALFVVDAAQTAGLIPLNMTKDSLDVVVFTGHKSLYGPQGTGGLAVAEGVHIPPFKVGGTGMHSFDEHHPNRMPESLEAGTLNGHGIAGLLAGVNYLNGVGVDNVRMQTKVLRQRFMDGCSAIPGIEVYGGGGLDNTGIVSLNVGAIDAAHISDLLSVDYGICTRAGAHCAPLMHRALGTEEQGAVRFSFSHFNTEEEIDTGIRALTKIAQACSAS